MFVFIAHVKIMSGLLALSFLLVFAHLSCLLNCRLTVPERLKTRALQRRPSPGTQKYRESQMCDARECSFRRWKTCGYCRRCSKALCRWTCGVMWMMCSATSATAHHGRMVEKCPGELTLCVAILFWAVANLNDLNF